MRKSHKPQSHYMSCVSSTTFTCHQTPFNISLSPRLHRSLPSLSPPSSFEILDRQRPATMTASADVARTVVGILGNIISGFLFLSPVPTFVGIWKKGSVQEFSPAPYLATLANCMVWTLYGLPIVRPHSILISTINGSGVVIEIVYIVLFLIYSPPRKRVKVLAWFILELIFMIALTVLTLTLTHSLKKRSAIVGTLCILFNIMMYASPLAVMKLVITTKSVEFMPFFISLAAFGNGVAWTTYALIRFDPFVTVPNGLGTLFAVAQLILYGTYYKNTKRLMEARKAKGELNLSEVVVGNGTQGPDKIDAAPK